jgi:hypothetical protein
VHVVGTVMVTVYQTRRIESVVLQATKQDTRRPGGQSHSWCGITVVSSSSFDRRQPETWLLRYLGKYSHVSTSFCCCCRCCCCWWLLQFPRTLDRNIRKRGQDLLLLRFYIVVVLTPPLPLSTQIANRQQATGNMP